MSTVGHMLTFKDGRFLSAGEKIAIGTRFIAHMEELRVGWIRVDANARRIGKVIAGRVNDGFVSADHEPANADDKSWWRFSNLVLRDFRSGDLYSFITAGGGGRNAVAELCLIYSEHRRGKPKELPIVALNTHVKAPSHPAFHVVGWILPPNEGIAAPTNILALD